MLVPETEIIVTKDGAEISRTTVKPGDYIIGREPGCDVQVDVELISRRHAQLTVNYDHVLIEDLGSSNGTFVNGKPVTEAVRLWPNQKIQVGAATIELRRVKTASSTNHSLAPQTATVQRLLPEDLLREKKYDIGGVIAQGGMGAILDAREAAIQRGVAMKVMLDGSSPEDLVRFIAEARVTGQLEHPNIVPIHELGVDENGQVFYTMKFVRGITLKKVLELLAAGTAATMAKYPLGQLLTVFQKVCDAVAFAHSKGVLHRDLKPENVMIGDFGEVLLMDWGLAKVLGQREAKPAHVSLNEPADASASATMAGSIMGTPQYMSPEQARGEIDELDARTDIYALGAILYHILALRPSVEGQSAMEIVEKVARGEIDPVDSPRRHEETRGQKRDSSSVSSSLRGHLPGGRIPDSLAAVVRKAMALNKAQRYAAVAELQADLTAFQNGFATSAEDAGVWKQLTLLIKRNKAAALGLAAVLIVGATLGTKSILEGRRAEREADAARATLRDLRRTAPVFSAQAKVVFEDGKIDEAIEKIGYAIQLDDTQADYHLFRAHLRESSQQLADAAEGYRRVLVLRPDDESAKTNLTLCEKLLRESGGGPLDRSQQAQLLSALRAQKRLIESVPLAALIDPDIKAARAALLARMHEFRNNPKWSDNKVSALSDGTFRIDFYSFSLTDLSFLKDQPVSALNVENTGLTDLSSLVGLPLKDLNLKSTKVTDLSPLREMPLEKLSISVTPVTDISPLRGMKLRSLSLSSGTTDLSPLAGMPLTFLECGSAKSITDLEPLRGAPLVDLSLGGTGVTRLAPLAGMPLKRLSLSNTKISDLTPLAKCTELEELVLNATVTDLTPLAKLHLTRLDCSGARLTSIAALRGQPLRSLAIGGKTGLTDLSPLAGCITLEDIVVPDTATDLSMLRQLPKLRAISTRGVGGGFGIKASQTAKEFWKQYDARAKGAPQ